MIPNIGWDNVPPLTGLNDVRLSPPTAHAVGYHVTPLARLVGNTASVMLEATASAASLKLAPQGA